MASQDGAGDGEEGDYGEDGGPGDEAGVDPLGHAVEPAQVRGLGRRDLLRVQLVLGVDDMVPDVGDPEAGQEEDDDDKEGRVLEPQREVGAAK